MSQIRIADEFELFNSLAPDNNLLSDSVMDYLKDIYTWIHMSKKEDDILEIFCNEPVNQERVQKAIKDSVKNEIVFLEKEINFNRKRMIRHYVAGFGLGLLGFILVSLTDKLLLEIISFFGTLMVRDAVMTQVQDNPKLKEKKEILEMIYNLKIIVSPENK